jgi:hypothetical protein
MDTNPPSPTPYPDDRRPDAVVLKDPSSPAVQGNLKAVIEVKIYPGDRWRKGQKQAYEKIAGDPDKVVEINNRNCPCSDDDDNRRVPDPVLSPDEEEETSPQADDASSMPGWVKPAAVAVAAVAVVAAAVLLAPEAAVGAGLAAGAAVFALISGPGTTEGGPGGA